MNAPRRRSATFEATLVYMDEPQLVALRTRKAPVVAIAIPSDDPEAAMFFAAAVTDKDWENYLYGTVDLRYLFTYPKNTRLYVFDLTKMKDGVVQMTPWDDDLPEEYLPEPRFFATDHTEEYRPLDISADEEVLIIDGEWDMPEIGQFYQKYSEVYSFMTAIKNWNDQAYAFDAKRKIKEAFLDRPFKGGFSYVHFYSALSGNLTRRERLSLDEIQYASPGHVNVHGRQDIFSDLQWLIPRFLDDRVFVQEEYAKLHGFLSKNRLLRVPGDRYPKNDPTAKFIASSAKKLAKKMGAPDFDSVFNLADRNALVAAKIVLSFYRRLDEAAEFFAQGRMTFPGE